MVSAGHVDGIVVQVLCLAQFSRHLQSLVGE